jgi:hypothetical protein
MRAPTLLVSSFAAAGALCAAAQPAASPPAPPCDPSDAAWVCNQRTPEDVVALPGGEWVLASAFQAPGGITLIKASDRTSQALFPGPAVKVQLDKKTYPDCPGPPADGFTTHGLYVGAGRGRAVQVMAVVHGPRESIDVLEADLRGGTPSFTFVGCVVAPEPIGLNSVRGLADGGFITTNWLARGAPRDALQKMMGGERNGELWEWHTASGWQKVPGSEAAGANGVELSDDGKTLYIAAWGSQSFIRLSRGAATPTREEVPLGFRVDNIHFAKDGSLLAAGQITNDDDRRSRVVKVDPKTLKVTDLLNVPDDAAFAGNTTAIEVGANLWRGSYRGDRISIVRAP